MFLTDLRLAGRRLARQPAFTLAAVLTLALGIGANLSVFAYVQSLLLAPINAPEPHRLVRIAEVTASRDGTTIVSWPNYVDMRDGASSLDLAAHGPASAQIGAHESSEVRPIELVSGNYFRVLGQIPQLGRFIDDEDNRAEPGQPVVVIGDAYWRTRYAGRPDVIGDTLLVNGAPFRIIGVGPEGFRGTYHAHGVDLWVPIATQQQTRPRNQTIENRNWGWLRLVGRLRPERTPDHAQAELDAVAASVNRRFPPPSPADEIQFAVHPASALAASDEQVLSPVLAAALAFTVLLFLVACANLAGVMQARLLSRTRELSIRQALGAGRVRASSEWAAECLVLAVAGGLAGVLVSRAVVIGIGMLRPPEQLVGDLTLTVAFDWRLAAYGLGLSVAAAMLFGLLPAFRIGRGGPWVNLKDEAGTATTSRSGMRLRRVAVVVQLALSGVLLVAAALLGASLANQQTFDPGFKTSNLGLLWVDLERQRVPGSEWRSLVDVALERVRQDPDVRSADVGFAVPLGFGEDVMGFRIPGHTPPNGRGVFSIHFNVVTAGYFATLGVPFVRGQGWMPTESGPIEVVVNETMARRFWPDGDAVGESIEFVGVGPVTIAGVARDTSYYTIGEAPLPFIYLPAERRMPGSFVLHVRTAGDATTVANRLRRSLEATDSRLTPYDAMSFEELRRAPLFPTRLLVATAVVFGGLATLLSGVGLYGVMALAVGERRREIGVRMALGARPGQVVGALFLEALVLSAAGLAIGCVGGYLAAGALTAWLFGVSPFDPALYAAVGAFVLLVAGLSVWMPARRAARVDPVLALRL